MTTDVTPQSHLLLPGLDGSNPLAFLAALGTLRTLTYAWPDQAVRMGWQKTGASWFPCIASQSLAGDDPQAPKQLIDALMNTLTSEIKPHPVRHWQAYLKADYEALGCAFSKVASSSTSEDRLEADWLSAITSFTPGDHELDDTRLRTTRADYHFGNVQSIVESTTADHLERSLLAPWDYGDPMANQSLHLDPTEDRRHAYQWNQPTSDPARKRSGSMLGANRLAIEGLPLIQTTRGSGPQVETVGFVGHYANDTSWSWPIWNALLPLPLVSSLLTHPQLLSPSPDARELKHRGVASVFRCHRILVGKTPNFTPARVVMS